MPAVHRRGVFVTATDTEVGKTYLAGAIVAALTARGERVAPYKPVVTGVAEPQAPGTTDPEILAAAAGGLAPLHLTAYRFGPPVSPHLAAAQDGATIELPGLVNGARDRGAGADALVVEGAGGLLVPVTGDVLMRDLMLALGLPIVVAARPGLGTINHTLLTLESARAAGLDVRGVALTPWPETPTSMQEDNRATIARLGAIDVALLPPVAAPTASALAAAGAQLPLDAWLGPAA